MRQIKKPLTLLLTLAMMLALLTGCGGGGETQNTGSGAADPTPSQTQEEQTGTRTITDLSGNEVVLPEVDMPKCFPWKTSTCILQGIFMRLLPPTI